MKFAEQITKYLFGYDREIPVIHPGGWGLSIGNLDEFKRQSFIHRLEWAKDPRWETYHVKGKFS